MNTSFSAKFLATAALAVAALGTVSSANARSDVFFSIGVQGAPVYVEPAPVYVQPAPVYVQPRPVYAQPRVYSAPIEYSEPRYYGAPATVYVQPGPPVYSYDDEREWRRAQWRQRHWRHHHGEWEQNRRYDREQY